MTNRNNIYIAFDKVSENCYQMLLEWKNKNKLNFDFDDAHEFNNESDKCLTESIKNQLSKKFDNSKIFVLFVGENAKSDRELISWEIKQALKKDLPIIVCYTNKPNLINFRDYPKELNGELALHIPFKLTAIKSALNNWSNQHQMLKQKDKKKPYPWYKSIFLQLKYVITKYRCNKVKLFSPSVRKTFTYFIGQASVALSFFMVAIDVPKNIPLIIILVLAFLSYISIWIYANNRQKISLKIRNTTINIFVSDLFKEEGLKVIPFNEFFDTQVDNVLIAESSLNGQYIQKHLKQTISELDNAIQQDGSLGEKTVMTDCSRTQGKTTKYQLGSIFVNEDFLLLALSHFDEHNRAYIERNEYVSMLIHFWEEVDCVHNDRTVVIPVLGTGITRIHGQHISHQELLELLILSFKMSSVDIKEPNSIKIVLHESKLEEYNLEKLKYIL